jgi:hypothetical protein
VFLVESELMLPSHQNNGAVCKSAVGHSFHLALHAVTPVTSHSWRHSGNVTLVASQWLRDASGVIVVT